MVAKLREQLELVRDELRHDRRDSSRVKAALDIVDRLLQGADSPRWYVPEMQNDEHAGKTADAITKARHEATFRSGQVVRLRSGGPDMTVWGLDPDHPKPEPGEYAKIMCIWFTTDGYAQREMFASFLLENADSALIKGRPPSVYSRD